MTHDKITDSEAVADAANHLYNTTETRKPPTDEWHAFLAGAKAGDSDQAAPEAGPSVTLAAENAAAVYPLLEGSARAYDWEYTLCPTNDNGLETTCDRCRTATCEIEWSGFAIRHWMQTHECEPT